MSCSLWLMRHGETAWTLTGQHTGSTDLPLTEEGERKAASVGQMLSKSLGGKQFAAVFVSPMTRAKETCRLAGYGDGAIVTEDLSEWNYGAYEGLTSPEIQKTTPGWTVWKVPPLGGETIAQVAERARRVIASAPDGDVAIFGHGHMLRVLTACWLQVDPDMGRCFALSTGSISVLAHERETPVIQMWNQTA